MTLPTDQLIARTIASEIGARPDQVGAAAALLDGGATVPFVARYRKEATGGLDDGQLRTLADRLVYLRELEARRASILGSIRDQGKLTPELEASIAGAASKAALEDLYLPFKPKRRTKAAIARERGLEPLVEAIRADRRTPPETLAQTFLGPEVPDAKEALAGARDILTETLSEDADLLGRLRGFLEKQALLTARLVPGQEEKGAKFSDYFAHSERWAGVPGHRALAMLRGSKEGALTLDIGPDPEAGAPEVEAMVAARLEAGSDGPGDRWLRDVARWAWRTKLSLTMMLDLLGQLRDRAQEEAITVFARNLRALLLAAPAGARPTMGLDPGVRTGVKVAVVDATGKLVATDTVYPFQPKNDLRGAQATLAALVRRHGVELIAIGNGTASRETEKLTAEMLAALPAPKPTKVVVSEAGASVYSASELAAKEFPGLDVSLRGAVSIARRLQDPLAELVKIDPKAIGVGQYQHDLSESRLARSLDAVVEDCVNAVGVDANTASAPLLARVSGIGAGLAQSIVQHRDANGPFKSRKALKDVARLGPKAFEQCAGFLRINGGTDPLDTSGVHPESYPVVRRILEATKSDIKALIGNAEAIRQLKPQAFVDDTFGLPTVTDILRELEKPGRDPRPAFKTAALKEGVETIKDLKKGMILEGTVTNVAAFGAFVDIGVHQDGLVHISAMSRTFIKDPREVVKSGDIVKVKVLDVEVARKRISLTLRLDDEVGKAAVAAKTASPRSPAAPARKPTPETGGAFAEAMRRASEKAGRDRP